MDDSVPASLGRHTDAGTSTTRFTLRDAMDGQPSELEPAGKRPRLRTAVSAPYGISSTRTSTFGAHHDWHDNSDKANTNGTTVFSGLCEENVRSPALSASQWAASVFDELLEHVVVCLQEVNEPAAAVEMLLDFLDSKLPSDVCRNHAERTELLSRLLGTVPAVTSLNADIFWFFHIAGLLPFTTYIFGLDRNCALCNIVIFLQDSLADPALAETLPSQASLSNEDQATEASVAMDIVKYLYLEANDIFINANASDSSRLLAYHHRREISDDSSTVIDSSLVASACASVLFQVLFSDCNESGLSSSSSSADMHRICPRVLTVARIQLLTAVLLAVEAVDTNGAIRRSSSSGALRDIDPYRGFCCWVCREIFECCRIQINPLDMLGSFGLLRLEFAQLLSIFPADVISQVIDQMLRSASLHTIMDWKSQHQLSRQSGLQWSEQSALETLFLYLATSYILQSNVCGFSDKRDSASRMVSEAALKNAEVIRKSIDPLHRHTASAVGWDVMLDCFNQTLQSAIKDSHSVRFHRSLAMIELMLKSFAACYAVLVSDHKRVSAPAAYKALLVGWLDIALGPTMGYNDLSFSTSTVSAASSSSSASTLPSLAQNVSSFAETLLCHCTTTLSVISMGATMLPTIKIACDVPDQRVVWIKYGSVMSVSQLGFVCLSLCEQVSFLSVDLLQSLGSALRRRMQCHRDAVETFLQTSRAKIAEGEGFALISVALSVSACAGCDVVPNSGNAIDSSGFAATSTGKAVTTSVIELSPEKILQWITTFIKSRTVPVGINHTCSLIGRQGSHAVLNALEGFFSKFPDLRSQGNELVMAMARPPNNICSIADAQAFVLKRDKEIANVKALKQSLQSISESMYLTDNLLTVVVEPLLVMLSNVSCVVTAGKVLTAILGEQLVDELKLIFKMACQLTSSLNECDLDAISARLNAVYSSSKAIDIATCNLSHLDCKIVMFKNIYTLSWGCVHKLVGKVTTQYLTIASPQLEVQQSQGDQTLEPSSERHLSERQLRAEIFLEHWRGWIALLSKAMILQSNVTDRPDRHIRDSRILLDLGLSTSAFLLGCICEQQDCFKLASLMINDISKLSDFTSTENRSSVSSGKRRSHLSECILRLKGFCYLMTTVIHWCVTFADNSKHCKELAVVTISEDLEGDQRQHDVLLASVVQQHACWVLCLLWMQAILADITEITGHVTTEISIEFLRYLESNRSLIEQLQRQIHRIAMDSGPADISSLSSDERLMWINSKPCSILQAMEAAAQKIVRQVFEPLSGTAHSPLPEQSGQFDGNCAFKSESRKYWSTMRCLAYMIYSSEISKKR